MTEEKFKNAQAILDQISLLKNIQEAMITKAVSVFDKRAPELRINADVLSDALFRTVVEHIHELEQKFSSL
jgi:hypothetical protein